MPRWLRVVVGAFVLSAWLTVAVSCRRRPRRRSAIDRWRVVLPGRTRDGTRPSLDPPRASQPRFAETARRPAPAADATSRTPQARDRTPHRVEASADDTASPDASAESSPRSAASKADADPARQAPALSAKPKLWQLPHALHNDRRVESTAAAVTPVTASKPTTAAPQRPAVTLRAVPSAQTPDLKPVAANICTRDIRRRRAHRPRIGAIDVPQLGRQATGLAVDVATVDGVGGPHRRKHRRPGLRPVQRFLGVPYLLAMSVVNAAAAVGPDPGRGTAGHRRGRAGFAVNYGILDGLAFFNPTKPPAGTNDPSITVTAEHPLPIILINGTTATQGVDWLVGAPALANAGYKVYTFNYGNATADRNFPIQSVGRRRAVRPGTRRRGGQGARRDGGPEGHPDRALTGRRHPARVLHQQCSTGRPRRCPRSSASPRAITAPTSIGLIGLQ